MVEVNGDLIIEIMRKIQADIAFMKHDVSELKTSIADLRQEVHTLKGDVLRQERAIAMLDLRVERIENRLELLRDA
jgi:predicted  nucleic acid-binding Zn-ribbon protein